MEKLDQNALEHGSMMPAKPQLQFEVVRLSDKTLDALKNWMHQMSAVAQELCEDKGMVSSAQCIARDAAALNEALLDELATENQQPKSPNVRISDGGLKASD
jgi:arsenate reductase-like glutaredoxin family protein